MFILNDVSCEIMNFFQMWKWAITRPLENDKLYKDAGLVPLAQQRLTCVTSPTGTHLSSVAGCPYKPKAPFSQNKILSLTQGERHQPLSPPLSR